MQAIPFCSPLDSLRQSRSAIDSAISRVLNSGNYILNDEVRKFENAFSGYVGTKYCISVANGTDAIFLSLRVLGIGQGHGVITTSHTAVATVTAIRMTGATPILIDVEEGGFNLDTDKIKNLLESKGSQIDGVEIKAIVPVHLYGEPCEMDEILALAGKYNLKIIEDCAQAHGAEYNGKKVGTFGELGCFSFYPTKNLGAIGDGGAIVTNSAIHAESLASLRQYGWRKRYISEIEGYNSRLDELQAAILSEKIPGLDDSNQRRIIIAEKYLKEIERMNIVLPKTHHHKKHVFHLFVIRTKKRDALLEFLSEKSISTAIHYPVPIHRQPAYSNLCFIPFELKNTELIANEILSLPMYPELTLSDAGIVTKAISEFTAIG